MSNNLNLIFDQWSASLKFKKRDKNNVLNNFDELFESLKRSDASFEEAHVFLAKAIKAHLPPTGLARTIYKNLKKNPSFDKTEKEYIELWHKSISDTATTSFFVWFPLPKDKDDDGEPKVFGSMSEKEYRTQRSYADSFPTLDTRELEQRMKSREYNLDIEDLIKHVLGGNNETNS